MSRKNSTQVHVFYPDEGTITHQENIHIPEEDYADGGPSFDFIKRVAKMPKESTYLEMLRVTLGGNRVPAWMFVDEDGIRKKLAPNAQATLIAGRMIVGPAVVWAGKYDQ